MNQSAEAPIRVASTSGVDLALHRFGGSGPTLVICHASGFHAQCYRPMLPTLTAAFDVWGMDFRGHGGSTVPAGEDFNWNGFADDLLATIDYLGGEPVRTFGHSMGGAATLLAEKRRPGIIEAAWLYEPIIFPPEIVPRNSQMAVAASKRRAEFPSKAEALMRYASRPPLGTLRADSLAAYVDGGFVDTGDGTVTLACEPGHEAATFNGARFHVSDIAGLTVRAIIACGVSDESPNPADFAGPTAEALPNAELVTYPGLTHFGPMQNPDLIANDAVSFLLGG